MTRTPPISTLSPTPPLSRPDRPRGAPPPAGKRLKGGGTLLQHHPELPRLWPPLTQHPREPHGRPSRAAGSAQAPPGRLHPVEGRRPAATANLAEPVGPRLPGLAYRVLGHVDVDPGRPVRPPHRRHRQRVPAPRGGDRAVGGSAGTSSGWYVVARRPAHAVRRAHGEVRGQLLP